MRYIGSLRRDGAARTDERVRLTGEVIQGALAMKMLGWEEPFSAAIRAIRKQVGWACKSSIYCTGCVDCAAQGGISA